VITALPVKAFTVVVPVTVKSSAICTVPPAESIPKLPAVVVIVLLFIDTLSIVALPVTLSAPSTVVPSRVVVPSTSKFTGILTLVPVVSNCTVAA